jgi:G3E family GTPase
MGKSLKIITYILLFTNLATFGVVGYLLYDLSQTRQETTVLVENLEAENTDDILFQRRQKNEIADIWEDQAALNDDLIAEQQDVIKSSEDYLAYIEDIIRFVNGEAQFQREVDEGEFLDNRNDLNIKIAELERFSQENAATKETYAERIRQLYLEAGEDRNNTVNDREGFR